MLKKDKEAKKKPEGKASSVVEDDVEMEESKSEPTKNGHTNGKKREPLEGQAKSKGVVAASKIANKRNQKEAIKKNKMKRNKGTVKEGSERPKSAQPAKDLD